jgi:hypothetical protein
MEPARHLASPVRQPVRQRQQDRARAPGSRVVWLPAARPQTDTVAETPVPSLRLVTGTAHPVSHFCAECHHARVDHVNALALCRLRSAEVAPAWHAAGEPACGMFVGRHGLTARIPAFAARKT